jgi:hypothetical protein
MLNKGSEHPTTVTWSTFSNFYNCL